MAKMTFPISYFINEIREQKVFSDYVLTFSQRLPYLILQLFACRFALMSISIHRLNSHCTLVTHPLPLLPPQKTWGGEARQAESFV